MNKPLAERITPRAWYVLEVMGRRFVAAPAYEGHPYFQRTRYIDIAADEDYPTKDADLEAIASIPEMLILLHKAASALTAVEVQFIGEPRSALLKKIKNFLGEEQ